MTRVVEGPVTTAELRLLDELSESPLPGARYAVDVVTRRLSAVAAEVRAAARAEVIAERDAELLKHGQINVCTIVGYEAGIEEGRRLAFAEIRAGVEGLPLYVGADAGATMRTSEVERLRGYRSRVLDLLPPTEPK